MIDADHVKGDKEELLKCDGLFEAWKLGVVNALEQSKSNDITLSKEEFVRYIDSLREANNLCNKIDDLMRESKDNIENDFMNGASLQINHESIVIELLCKLMHDDEIYSDISYFIYELDYGRDYRSGMIKDNDGNEIDFSTADKLYDYLAKNYEVDNNEI